MKKKIYLNLIGIILLLFFAGYANAQNLTIKGKVTSTLTKEALPGVNVVIKGTTQGTATNTDGEFTLVVPNENSVLTFSFIGQVTQEIKVGQQLVINVEMADDVTKLDELVVIGYGVQKKEEVTTSMAKVKSDDFVQGMVKSPAQLLQGKVAGLGISNINGSPTEPIQFMIRGTSTLASGQDPLVVIDGIPGGSLYAIAPEDIESMTVLKDGSSAAIYGTRGTNGVIIITTKRGNGKKGASVEYNMSVSMDEIAGTRQMLTADDYLRLGKDTATIITGTKLAQQIFQPLDKGSKTDWVKAITRKPINQVHNLSFEGGDEKSNFIASLTYRDMNGILLNSDRTSYSARVSVNHSALNDRLRLNLNINNSTYKDHDVWTEAYRTALLMNPTAPIYNTDGSYFEWGSVTKPFNPVALLKEETNLNNWNELLTNGKITIEPIKGWNIGATGGIQRNDGMRDKWSTLEHENNTISGLGGRVEKWANQNFDYTGELTTDFSKTIGSHNFSIMGGYSNQYFVISNSHMLATLFGSDQFQAWSFAPSLSTAKGTSVLEADKQDSKLIAFFGRATYNYNQKYLLMATLRREGSSKFGANNKWGYFPAVSLGWRINKESFMQNVSFVDDLKLRAGYGVTGTIPNDSYMSLLLLKYDDTKQAYMNGSWVKGVVPDHNPNPDLKWEVKQEYNFGLDFGLFKDMLSGTVDLYKRLTSDLLFGYTVPVPPNKASTTFANAAKIENKGIEVVLNSTIINKNKFKIMVSGNMAYNKNTVKNLDNNLYSLTELDAGYTGSPIQTYTHKIVPGEPIGNFYGFKAVGVTQNQKVSANNGLWRYLSSTGDTVTTTLEKDKRVLGNGIPKIFAGINATILYRGFDFYISFRGAFKFQVYNQFRSQFETFAVIGTDNIPKATLDKPFGSSSSVNNAPSYNSYYIENGDYVKLDNISLGYTFKLPQSWSISKFRIYVSGINLHTFTKYKGLDPEVSILKDAISGQMNPGMEPWDAYPKTRTYTMGLNLTF
jgi:TonB-linked SusC/RagA family outer membrane protein